MQIQFYHLLTTPLERALFKLLEKAYAGGFRSLVLTASQNDAENLGRYLWSCDQDGFLPHGTINDGRAQRQPVYITAEPDNPNKANLLIVTDGSELDDICEFERVIDIFDGRNEAVTASARRRWKTYADAGFDLSYIKQNDRGGWDMSPGI